MAIRKFNDLQLTFDLELDEVELDAAERQISPEEARLISEAARTAFTPASDWAEYYLKLRERGWPWRVACYIAWASSPKKNRWPGTLEKLATEVLRLNSPRTIYTWRKKHPTIDEVISDIQAAPLFEHRRDVFEALITMAKDPNYKGFRDRKLFLEILGDYVPKRKIEHSKGEGAGTDEMSDEELKQWMGEEIHHGDTEDTEIASKDTRNDG